MGLFNFIVPKKETRNYEYGGALSINQLVAHLGRKTTVSAEVRAIQMIADFVSELPLNLYNYDKKNGNKIPNYSHSIVPLLQTQPSKRYNKVQFWRLMITTMLQRGDSYAIIYRNRETGSAEQLVYCPNQLITPIPVGTNDLLSPYKWNTPLGVKDDADVIHLTNSVLDCDNAQMGKSFHELCPTLFSIGGAEQNQAEKFYKSGGVSGFISTTSAVVPKKQKDQLRADFEQVSRQGGLVVLENGMSYQQNQWSNKDSQLLESRLHTEKEISLLYGIPFGMLDSTSSTYNLETNLLLFLINQQPLITQIEEQLMKVFLPSERAKMKIEFDTTSWLRADKQSLANYYSKLLNSAVVTPSEIRKALSLPPIDEEYSDHLYMQSNLVSIEKANQQTQEQAQQNALPNKKDNNEE